MCIYTLRSWKVSIYYILFGILRNCSFSRKWHHVPAKRHVHQIGAASDLFSTKAIIHFSSFSGHIFSRIKFFGPSRFVIATGDRLTRWIHTHVTSGSVNWWRRSFRYKYLNETRVQIHAAHTKQIPHTLPFLISFGPHICGYPSPSPFSFNRSPRCTWVLCLDDGVRCTRLTGYYQRKIKRLHKLSL